MQRRRLIGLTIVLSKYGFQGSILSAILALYSSPMAHVYMSVFLSKAFNISNGTRQGCPLSPTIFNLMIEPLSEMIRSHHYITDIKFNSRSHVTNLFADNVILKLTDPLTSLPHAHQVLASFSAISFFRVNFTKTLFLDLETQPNTKLHSNVRYRLCGAHTKYLT